MSLDTVLKIGKIYRQSKQGLEQHRYIKSIWKDVEIFKKNKDRSGNSIDTVFYSLPVLDQGEGFVFDFDNLSIITDEDKKKSLKYLNFKTSDKDSEKKYLYGDIIYSNYTDRKGVEIEVGNYKMEKLTKGKIKLSSFGRALEDAKDLENTNIGIFRKAFKVYQSHVEQLLLKHPAVVLHFSFGNNTMWHEEQNTLNLINTKLIAGFIIDNLSIQKTVLDKFLFKTIGGVNPGFSEESSYKVKSFNSADDVIDLMYGVSISEKVLINVRDIGIVVLPNGENLNADILDRFYHRKGLQEVTGYEGTLNEENKSKSDTDNYDSIFDDLTDNEFSDNVKYDIVFMKPAGLSSPSVDMIEISSIEKSFLKNVHEKVLNTKVELKKKSEKLLGKSKLQPKYDIKASFLEILSQKGKNQKKYSFHLLKVLPQIYTDTYYNDPVLLPALIEKVERNIRDGFNNYNILKYDFYFLTQIQKLNNMSEIFNSKNYAIGKALGLMARPFAAWRDDCPIKSFEKSYVGNLTMRIGDLKDLTKFSNFLNEKLTIHEKNYKEIKEAYISLVENIKELGTTKEKYDKNTCALGFFESYFSH
jgi:hypothetical protein